MIPANAITAWGVDHPWPTREQVEQDLLLSQAICAIAEHEYLGTELVFRGGTALHKLHLDHPYRYSEDLDYVRSSASGIGPLTRALCDLGVDLGYTVNTRVSQHPKGLLANHRRLRHPATDQDRDQHPRTIPRPAPDPPNPPRRLELVDRTGPGTDLPTSRTRRHQDPRPLPTIQGPRPVRPVPRAQPTPPPRVGHSVRVRALPARRTHRRPGPRQPRTQAPRPALPQRSRPARHHLARHLPTRDGSDPDHQRDPRPPRRLTRAWDAAAVASTLQSNRCSTLLKCPNACTPHPSTRSDLRTDPARTSSTKDAGSS